MSGSGSSDSRGDFRDVEHRSEQINVLYADADETYLRSLSEQAQTHPQQFRVVTRSDPAALQSLSEQNAFDCLVLTLGFLDECGPTVDTADIPIILYTDAALSDLDETALEFADSVVEKTESGKQEFLLTKIRGIVQTRGQQAIEARETGIAALEGDLSATTGSFLVDESGEVRWSNVELSELFEVDPGRVSNDDETFYRRLAALIDADPETRRELQALRGETGETTTGVLESRRTEGQSQYIHASQPVRETTGSRFEILQPASSMADHYARHELLQELVQNAQDGLYMLDADGRIIYLNDSFAEMLEYEQERLLGEHISELIAGGELGSGQQLIEGMLETGTGSAVSETTLETSGGEQIETSVNFTIRRGPEATYAGLMGVVRDITERRKRERKLEEYRALVESAGDPMYVLDSEGHIQLHNQAMAEFFGLDANSVQGTHIREILPDSAVDKGEQSVLRVLEDDSIDRDSVEAWVVDGDGNDRLVEATIGTVMEDEELSGTVFTLRDMTERHRRAAEIDLLKQIFSRSLRHNIRNKASVIGGFATLLAEELDGDHAEMAEAILRASDSLSRTSQKVSDLDVIVNADFELVEHDLETLLGASIEQARETNPAATVEFDVPDPIKVQGIKDLDYAFENIIENAFEHGVVGGTSTIDVRTEVGENTVTVTVSDDGPGIPDEEIEVLREGEETSLRHGSGLGLWLVAQVVERSGGEVSFDIDDGTSVHVTLPRAEESTESSAGADRA
jgi:PAS domain S-box-containing protein